MPGDDDLLNAGGEGLADQTTTQPGEGEEGAPEPSLRDTIASAIAEQKDAQDAAAAAAEGVHPKPTPVKGADGRFVKGGAPPAGKAAPAKGKGAAAPGAAVQPPQGQQTAPPGQAAPQPPPGWSPASKAAFATLPPHVQADVAKRENEVAQGLARLADFKGVERFADAARQSGTNLENALVAYTSIETLLRQDPAAGLIEVMKNVRMQPAILLGEVIRRLGGDPRAAAATNVQGGQLPPQLLNQINALTDYMQNSVRERDMSNLQQAQRQVGDFWGDPKNQYAENVAPIMVDLINIAKARGEPIDLAKIYETACYQHPEVRQLLINEQLASRSAINGGRNAAVAASARSAARATTGAPAAGMSPAQRAPNPDESLRDTIRAAVDAQRGAV